MAGAVLRGGLATSIGSLPHSDAGAAAALVLRLHPDLPAAPQLPHRNAREGMLAQWLRALPEVSVADDGALALLDEARRSAGDGALDTTFDAMAHGGFLGFVDACAALARTPKAIKVQVTGPLTLGLALHELGLPAPLAFDRGAQCAMAWARSLVRHVHLRLPETEVVTFFDEPGLVAFQVDEPLIDAETASDLLSGALAAAGSTVGVHVCGDGALPIALSAGPSIIGVEVHGRLIGHAASLARFLDEGGFIAWGAVPTDRPIGEQPAPLWKALVELWCELTRRGCDPVRLRQQAIVTPACGLALHGVSQAERALRLARDIADRVFDQAAATKLTVGA